jgi:acyl-CoA thioester hydrolase
VSTPTAKPTRRKAEPRESPEFTVVHEIVPRFRDTDAMGHINNAVYVTYLEVARQVYWAKLDEHADYRRVPFILAHVDVDFRSEALVNEVLEAGIRMEWISRSSFAFRYRIWEKSSGRVVVEANTVQVCYDYRDKKTIPMPDPLRRSLEAFEGRGLPGKP